MSDFSQRFMLYASVVLGVFVLIMQLVLGVEESVDQWEKKADKQEAIFQEVALLAKRLQSVRDSGSKTDKSGKKTGSIPSLLPWLEKETAQSKLSTHIRQIAPVALQSVESGLYREKATLGLKAIPISQALTFLNRLESVDGVRVVQGVVKRPSKGLIGVEISLEIGLL